MKRDLYCIAFACNKQTVIKNIQGNNELCIALRTFGKPNDGFWQDAKKLQWLKSHEGKTK